MVWTSVLGPTRLKGGLSDNDTVHRWEMENKVRDAVASANKGWLILVVIAGIFLFFWAVNLRTCQSVDYTNYVLNPSDVAVNGYEPDSAQLCTYAISGDRELTLSYPDAAKQPDITVKLTR